MPVKSAVMVHHNFTPKPRIDLEDAKISGEMKHKLQILKQDYDDMVSSDTGFTHLEK